MVPLLAQNIIYMNIKSFGNKEICGYLASRVRAERHVKKYSQAEFAKVAGISLRTYKRFESNGQGSIETLIQVLRGFDKLRMLEAIFPLPAEPRLRPDERVAKIALKVFKDY